MHGWKHGTIAMKLMCLLRTPLIKLPLYLLLRTASGVVTPVFSQTAKFSEALFDGMAGPSAMPTAALLLILSLLVVKTIATALAAGSGLVGGTFALTLFLGVMAGASFHNIMSSLFQFGMQGDLGFLT